MYGGKKSLLKSPAWEKALSHVLQFTEHNISFNNSFQALFPDFSISYIIILLLWQNWLYTTWFLPNKCHLSCYTVSASNFSLVFTTCSTSYQLSPVKPDKSLLQARDLPRQFLRASYPPLQKKWKYNKISQKTLHRWSPIPHTPCIKTQTPVWSNWLLLHNPTFGHVSNSPFPFLANNCEEKYCLLFYFN